MKKFFCILLCLALIIVSCSDVFASYTNVKATVTRPTNPYNNATVDTTIKNKTENLWATMVFIVQITSVACVVFAGVRFMFSSADKKADIKQGLIYLAVGASVVFGATLIIQLVAGAAEDIL